MLLAVALGAVGTDLALWTTGPGLAWTIGATAAAVAVAVGARPTRPAAWALLAAVPLLAGWCSVRTSPWLIAPDIVAVNLCLILGADLASRGRWSDRSLPRLVAGAASLAEDLLVAGAWVAPALRAEPGDAAATRVRRDWKPILGGLAVGVPIVTTLTALLASADPVFASFFDLGLEASVVTRHVIFVAAGGWAVLALLRKASTTSETPLPTTAGVSATIGNVVLLGVAAVFALYASGRVLALTGTAERIAETRGLTWADHARSGFFQLLAVAAITLVVLLGVCGWCRRGDAAQRRRRTTLGLVIVVEIVGIVVDALHRLDGYEDAYGLTMLRLSSSAFAVWIGVVFVIVAIALATDYGGRRWLAPAILTTALAGLLVFNAANPERIVAHRNLTGPTRAGETDLTYLVTELGDDALPTVVDHFERLGDDPPAEVADSVCWAHRPSDQWFNPNLSRDEGDRAVRAWCEDRAR